jgi:hypothetical protein
MQTFLSDEEMTMMKIPEKMKRTGLRIEGEDYAQQSIVYDINNKMKFIGRQVECVQFVCDEDEKLRALIGKVG